MMLVIGWTDNSEQLVLPNVKSSVLKLKHIV